MTTITSRVGSAPTADSTKRVTTTGADPGIPSSVGTDTWGGTWGGTWGRTWFFGTLATGATPASPSFGGITQRIPYLLLLEGDESGELLLEGDAEEDGALGLEGDEAAASITANHTKRVEAIS